MRSFMPLLRPPCLPHTPALWHAGAMSPALTLAAPSPTHVSSANIVEWDSRSQYRPGDLVVLRPEGLVLNPPPNAAADRPVFQLVNTCRPGFHPRCFQSRVIQVCVPGGGGE